MHGWAQDITVLVREPVDGISASALLHEVYSYGGAYSGLNTMIRTFPTVLKPFVYRDVYAVDAPSLHEPAVQSYSASRSPGRRPALPRSGHVRRPLITT